MSELTSEQEATLAAYVDGDATTSIPKFQWDDLFQRKLLGLLLTDRFFLTQSMGLVKAEYFSNQAHVNIARYLFKHFEHYKAIPEPFLIQQHLRDVLKDRDEGMVLFQLAELNSLYEYYVPGIQTRNVLRDKITNFAKIQALRLAFHVCQEKVTESPEDEKTWSFVYESLRQAMLVEKRTEQGLNYFENIDELFRRLSQGNDPKDRFTSGFTVIDEAITGGGLTRGEIGAWIGLPGTGKSLALVRAAVSNVIMGKKVLYITLEMNEVGIASRFTSQFTNHNVNHLLDFRTEISETIREFVKDMADKNRLIITQFPGGQIDVNAIRAYHSHLQLEGFKPDLIIVDYVGEMKDDPNYKTYESRYHILRDLRGFGVDENHCTLTCVQPNASAAKLTVAEYIDEGNIGTSFDQYKPLDAFWSLNQTNLEKDVEVGRVFVIKHRNGRSRFPFQIGFDYERCTLNLFHISKENYKVRMNAKTEEKAEEVKIDGSDLGKGKKQRSKRGFMAKEADTTVDGHDPVNPSEDETVVD